MDEDKFNIEMRKFLKKVGITSQRLIEQHVRDALAAGKLAGGEPLTVRATLEIESLGLKEPIEGQIKID